ncbi:unnamed protein product [Ostreobium quekettii]|uniref:Protein root UVB sensitive/RUS domain-containing protein n=1 Tax=Ostreobium quekettii TaxID=121088 RepID=A0A8S1IXS0_9CHLO|nr:unnamed protein product [Ostreobium quekettii]
MPRRGQNSKALEAPSSCHPVPASHLPATQDVVSPCPGAVQKLPIIDSATNAARGIATNVQKINRALRRRLQARHRRSDGDDARDDPDSDNQSLVNPLSLSLLFGSRAPVDGKVLQHEMPQWWNPWGGHEPPGTGIPGWRSRRGAPVHILPSDKRPSKKKATKVGGVVHGRNTRGRGLESEGGRGGEGEDVMCVEVTKGRRRVYRRRGQVEGEAGPAFWAEEEEESRNQQMRNVFHSYLLPNGFPESVGPQYANYMMWRSVQYLFGGTMAVFTTKSLLGSLGIAGRRSGEAAAAINWVLKDGAGRVGRLMFARWGRALDSELKQFRMMGDMLMEVGAAMELSTIMVPELFLPLACTANLSKNLAAVAASSTRGPIYRNFALQNNMADITAKGESIANLADIVGTVAGIVLSKMRVPVLPTFLCLSTGYLIASRQEIAAVELPYLNRARLSLASRTFLETGPSTKKTYVLLREGVKPLDIMHASFTAHTFTHLLTHSSRAPNWTDSLAPALQPHHPESNPNSGSSHASDRRRHDGGHARGKGEREGQARDWQGALQATLEVGDALFRTFRDQASAAGWKLQATTLNAQDTRLVAA